MGRHRQLSPGRARRQARSPRRSRARASESLEEPDMVDTVLGALPHDLCRLRRADHDQHAVDGIRHRGQVHVAGVALDFMCVGIDGTTSQPWSRSALYTVLPNDLGQARPRRPRSGPRPGTSERLLFRSCRPLREPPTDLLASDVSVNWLKSPVRAQGHDVRGTPPLSRDAVCPCMSCDDCAPPAFAAGSAGVGGLAAERARRCRRGIGRRRLPRASVHGVRQARRASSRSPASGPRSRPAGLRLPRLQLTIVRRSRDASALLVGSAVATVGAGLDPSERTEVAVALALAVAGIALVAWLCAWDSSPTCYRSRAGRLHDRCRCRHDREPAAQPHRHLLSHRDTCRGLSTHRGDR